MSRRLKQQAVGEHIRRLRLGLGFSLRELAARTDFTASFISQVENGRVSPSIGSMEKIAAALQVTMGEFFAAAAQGESGVVIRRNERPALSSGWSAADIEALSPMAPDRRLEPTLVTLGPGGRSGKHPYAHRNEEFAYVLQGAITLTLGPEVHALGAGDAVTILPGELRLFENRSEAMAQVLIVGVHARPRAQPRAERSQRR
jgi:transcriptional regulator with XRE-family HTH domain